MKKDNGFAHWSDYWANGYLTSLPADFRANYDGEVAEFWARQFAAAPKDARILDLCTGNGAVALLAARYARDEELDFQITAVDAAGIDTERVAERFPALADLLPGIRFIGGQRVEDLDFSERSFDLVTSQFGVEYCDWSAAAATVARVLKPGGRFALVSHESTSDILKYMEQEYREYQLLEELGFHSTIRAFLDNRMRYAEMKSKMREVQDRLGQALITHPSPFLRSMHNGINGLLVMSKSALRRQLRGLHRFQRQTALGQARLEDMLRVNHAIRDEPDWYRAFETGSMGLSDEGDLYYRAKHHAGRYYCFEKS